MTGGRLYAHTLDAIIPGFAASAPVERKVTREKISFLTEESAVTLDFHREQPDVPQHASYTVLRNRLDPWLMEQAEQAGAQFILAYASMHWFVKETRSLASRPGMIFSKRMW